MVPTLTLYQYYNTTHHYQLQPQQPKEDDDNDVEDVPCSKMATGHLIERRAVYHSNSYITCDSTPLSIQSTLDHHGTMV